MGKKHVTSLRDKSLIFNIREYAGRFYQNICFSPLSLNECLKKVDGRGPTSLRSFGPALNNIWVQARHVTMNSHTAKPSSTLGTQPPPPWHRRMATCAPGQAAPSHPSLGVAPVAGQHQMPLWCHSQQVPMGGSRAHRSPK